MLRLYSSQYFYSQETNSFTVDAVLGSFCGVNLSVPANINLEYVNYLSRHTHAITCCLAVSTTVIYVNLHVREISRSDTRNPYCFDLCGRSRIGGDLA